MRMYQVRGRTGKTIAFARTAGYARDYVREDDPSARKNNNSVYGVDIFTNGMSITLIDIKADKEGVITLLNSIISQPEQEPVQKPTEQVVEETAKTVSPTPEDELKVDTIVPAIAYKVDNMPWPKKGRGTCLHCRKQVGFVGGWPCVNPPDAICD